MADSTAHAAPAEHTSTGLPSTKLAMWLFLASECLLFGALIPTSVLYRGASTTGPSSLTMVLSLTAADQRDFARMRLWLIATAMLGLTFVGGQVYEFTSFYHEGLTLKSNLFGTTFYVLTGFHGVHVTVGILMLLSLVGMSWAGRLPDDQAFPVEMVGLYWHFVDIVWIVIFTVVYLVPQAKPAG